jgi:L-aminopeptidase/D-esterase-like protein
MAADPHRSTPAGRPRARALGIPLDGEPGPANAITDVGGVTVGYVTLVRGHGPLRVGEGPVRTGVTAILPRQGAGILTPVFAGFHSSNGNGELTGAHLVEEIGRLALPITLTNTHACGITRDATIAWAARAYPAALAATWALPVAAETYDGYLNDINGGHVTAAHAVEAIQAARPGPIEEGSVGGGTGMIAFGFKAGSGTASRRVPSTGQTCTVGVFVQANFGRRENFMIRGRRWSAAGAPRSSAPAPAGEHAGTAAPQPGEPGGGAPPSKSSIIGIVATDAPLLPHQLRRLARRAAFGVAWTGGLAHHGSGDLFLAFSTANGEALAAGETPLARADFVPDERLDPFFDAVVQAVEEAILNSLVAAEPMDGRDGHTVPALPHDVVRQLFA